MSFNVHTSSRGAILVASHDRVFVNVIGQMVLEAGFYPAFAMSGEAAGALLTRTRPLIAICDCDDTRRRNRALMTGASARGIPLLLSQSPSDPELIDDLALTSQVAWLRFPVSPRAFLEIIESLLPSTSPALLPRLGTPIALNMGSPIFDNAIGLYPTRARGERSRSVRVLPFVRRRVGAGAAGVGGSRRRIPGVQDGDTADNERADDDGMPRWVASGRGGLDAADRAI